jgi:hypothetical protein
MIHTFMLRTHADNANTERKQRKCCIRVISSSIHLEELSVDVGRCAMQQLRYQCTNYVLFLYGTSFGGNWGTSWRNDIFAGQLSSIQTIFLRVYRIDFIRLFLCFQGMSSCWHDLHPLPGWYVLHGGLEFFFIYALCQNFVK